MKSIVLLSLLLGGFAQAQNVILPAAKMEVGHYTGVDVESGTLNADVTLNADKTLIFKLKSADFEVPEPGCTGIYEEIGNDVISDVTCPLEFLKQTKVRLDITAVTYDSVRAPEGVIIPVFVEAIGEDPILFKMKLVEPAVVPVP